MLPYSQSGLPRRPLFQQIDCYWQRLRQQLLPEESADYRQWRHGFLYQRLGFGLWIGLVCFLVSSSHDLYLYLLKIEQIREYLDRYYEEPWLAEPLREIAMINFFVIAGLIVGCLWLQQTRFGKRYPAVTFLIFASSVNGFATQLISTFYGVPIAPNTIVFLASAVLLPLRWRLQLLAQLLPISYYAVVLPLLGITQVGSVSIFDNIYSPGTFIELGLVCLICNVSVFVYERLQRAEFESRRELQIFLHAISHDLRNPVVGTSVVISNLLKKATDGQTVVRTPVLERLLQGSDRQLRLINSLVEAYHADSEGMVLHLQPVQLGTTAGAVLADIEPRLIQNKIDLHNTIDDNLPLVSADPTHIWRVFSNLIDNALKHNPPGIQIVLEAEVITYIQSAPLKSAKGSQKNRDLHQLLSGKPCPRSRAIPMLLCRIKDTGIGISVEQRSRLFELYTRGNRARYMPGLGLGLHLCKQIITAHGGDIGVVSQPEDGSIFWFTLPLAETSSYGKRSSDDIQPVGDIRPRSHCP
ncbi:MAG: HAMP domain-containing sensor histidine kinase [Cyanobacteria bacterium P01_C01_bin.120]